MSKIDNMTKLVSLNRDILNSKTPDILIAEKENLYSSILKQSIIDQDILEVKMLLTHEFSKFIGIGIIQSVYLSLDVSYFMSNTTNSRILEIIQLLKDEVDDAYI